MKSNVLKSIAAFVILVVLVVTATGCEQFFEALAEALESEAPSSGTAAPGPDETADTGTETATEGPDSIPYRETPKVDVKPLPEETFADDVEKEASDIIDGAIAKAVAYVGVMKDDRHSSVSYSYDAEAGGAFSGLTDPERKLLDDFIKDSYEYKAFRVESDNFDGDLKKSFFHVTSALLFGADPFITCFADIEPYSIFPVGAEETIYKAVYSYFFNPYKDGNERLSEESIAMLKHDMTLLDRIVKRIVRYMPEGLTTYDKYYYLAAVLSEHVMYDERRPDCYSAFGALVEGRAVCEGYSLAYLLLCKEADLWCALRCGQPEGVGHQWNMIKLESGIYNVDVTWCDTDTALTQKWYKCFVKTDEFFTEDGHCITVGVSSTGSYEPNPYEN